MGEVKVTATKFKQTGRFTKTAVDLAYMAQNAINVTVDGVKATAEAQARHDYIVAILQYNIGLTTRKVRSSGSVSCNGNNDWVAAWVFMPLGRLPPEKGSRKPLSKATLGVSPINSARVSMEQPTPLFQ